MKQEAFWAETSRGVVRYENCEILTDCTKSEAKDIARQLNNVVARACKHRRPIDVVAAKLGRLTKDEERFVLLMRYAVMYVLDHE